MIIDYADYIDLHKTTLKIISSLTTLTALIIKITWRIVLSWLRWLRWCIDYSDKADYTDIQLYVKNNFIIGYTNYGVWKATIDNTFITDYADIQKWKIVITDYDDYPVLNITVTYTGIFFRNFCVVLHASLAL